MPSVDKGNASTGRTGTGGAADNNNATTSAGDDAADTALSDHQHQTPRVLGVAFIVDHSSGPRLLARYPTRPPPKHISTVSAITNHSSSLVSSSSSVSRVTNRRSTTTDWDDAISSIPKVVPPDDDNGDDNDDYDDDEHRYASQKDELFFTLTPRQMAKLFRTKKALCGQPMTLRVNQTVFCCHAVLLDTGDDTTNANNNIAVTNDNSDDNAMPASRTDQDDNSTAAAGVGGEAYTPSDENASLSNNTATKEDKLCLFSVVVALSAPDRHGTVPFSSFWDANNDDHLDLQRFLQEISAATSHKSRNTVKKATAARVSATFLAIRRVHISISRYVRALTREESRCQYVTLQAQSFFEIRNGYQPSIPSSSCGGIVPSTATTSTTQNTSQDQPRRPTHSRQVSNTPSSVEDGGVLNRFLQASPYAVSVAEEQEKEQEILELMLAAPPPRLPPEHSSGITALRFKSQGNLVRELLDLFHSLARNDIASIPTPTALLTGKETVIYVNKHIAIPIEPVGLDKSRPSADPTVKPFHTLLFPHAAPADVLDTFRISGSTTPHKLEQLLLTVSSKKSLAEIAMANNLPLHTTLEIASFLVTQGICISSPVIRPTSRLSCVNIRKISESALEFSESFPSINVFQAVSFLTSSSRTLGETIAVVADIDNIDGAWLRDAVATHGENTRLRSLENPLSPTQPQEDTRHWVQRLEDVVFSIAEWLMSRQVIETLQDYVVLVDETPPEQSPSTSQNNPAFNDGKSRSMSDEQQQQKHKRPSTPSSSSPSRRSTPTQDVDENLFREITNLYLLNGKLSATALAWQLGMDVVKIRSWAMRHPRIRLLWRVPSLNDDSVFRDVTH